MNYELHYSRLIKRARNRTILPNEYKEKHHILPRCIGGTNAKDNLVFLFPEEHLIAHLLLTKMYPDNKKHIYAANRLVNVYSKTQKVNNKKYGWLKRKFNEVNSTKTPALRKMYSDRMKEFNKTYVATEETNRKISSSVAEGWNNNIVRKEQHAKRFEGENNPRFDKNLYEFKHNDGRIIVCHQSELKNTYGCDRAYALISGKAKTNKGWKFTGKIIGDRD